MYFITPRKICKLNTHLQCDTRIMKIYVLMIKNLKKLIWLRCNIITLYPEITTGAVNEKQFEFNRKLNPVADVMCGVEHATKQASCIKYRPNKIRYPGKYNNSTSHDSVSWNG